MGVLDRVRPAIRRMDGYAPGEQPAPGQRFVKLNTNENPFPPHAVVQQAIRDHAEKAHQLYPDPSSRRLRQVAARVYGFHEDQVVAGNGSDDLLTMILRTFIDPGQKVVSLDPTYSLYRCLTEMQGGVYESQDWLEDGGLPVEALAAQHAQLYFVVRPNAPTGHAIPLAQVEALCRATEGVVVLDEAYADFCEDNGLGLLARCPNLIITRTFSKAFSLAGMRIGLGFMAAEVAAELHKVRDSYNLDGIAQAVATATLEHLDLLLPRVEAIKKERDTFTVALRQRGFEVPSSQANFVLATVPAGKRSALNWLEDLRAEGFLVRYFGSNAKLRDKIRISIGSETDMAQLLAAIDGLLATNS